MYNEYTPEIISELKGNDIFVFSRNQNSYHAGGAARVAMENFGTVWWHSTWHKKNRIE